jgi:two-component system sensor histidine kinase YesM
MSIKSKLFLFTLLIMSLGITITFSSLYYVYHIYDQQLYEKSSDVLNLSSSAIETELKKIQRLSFVILSDSEIQSALIAIHEGNPDYENYQNRYALKNKLVRYIGSENYVLSLHVIDSLNNESFVEGYSVTIPDDKKNAIRQETHQAAGEIRFFYPDENDSAVILAREIRSYEGLSLTPIGTLIIRVDMKKLVDDFAAGSRMKNGELLMVSDNQKVIFTNKQLSGRLPATFDSSNQTGYEIASMNGETFFVSHIHSDYTGWTYYNLLPFNQIFQNIVFMKNMLIAGFVATFLTVMVIGLSFARSITKPIERLTGQMRQLQKGSLESMELSELAPVSVNMDEVGLMHRTFRMMITRINDLIRENYAKQLVIKATEFKALQAQINPHFLYNTLESINWLAKMNGQKQIYGMVE